MKKLVVFFILIFYSNLYALTLEDAIDYGIKNYNLLAEQKYKKDASLLRYKASLDPYYPYLDIGIGYSNYINSHINPAIDNKGFYSGSLSLGYKIYEPRREHQKNNQQYVYLYEKYQIDVIKNDLIKLIKDYYYKAVSDREIAKIREESYQLAQKIYELSKAKFEVGIARISEVSQSRVNLENSKMELLNAKAALAKSLSDLSSLIALEVKPEDLLDGLSIFSIPVAEEELRKLAVERRPEIIKELINEKRLEVERRLTRADFYPSITASLIYRRYDDKFFPSPDESRFDINLTYNVFSGFGKFYRMDASKLEMEAQKKRLDETKRNIYLEIKKNYIDMDTAFQRIKAAEDILAAAEKTYEQTYEEYRIGRGDILNLIQSELNLASARIQKVNAFYLLYQAKNSLERAVGLTNIEELK